MNKIIWSDDCSVGNKTLDEQHQKIISLLNALQEYLNSSVEHKVITETLYEMIQYSNYHLRFEETLLEELGYRDLAEHKQSHYRYLEKVADISLDANKETNDHMVLNEIFRFLRFWWENHILVEDMEYKSFIEGKKDYLP